MDRLNTRLLASVYAPPPARSPWRLEDLIPGAPLRYYSFGRRALAAGLSAAGVKTGDPVLLPGFICRDLLSSLAAAGARAVYYEVDEKLRPARDPVDWPRAAAVVAVNCFGFAQDLAPFRRYCGLRGAVLIEDNAHGLFSRDAQGKLLGTRGDLGIFSLRKTLPLPDGAALALSAEGRRIRPPAQEPFDAPDSPRYLLRQAGRTLAGRLGARAALRGLSLLRELRRLRTGSRLPPPPRDAETLLPRPENPCGQLAHALVVADPELEARRRRDLYGLLADRLEPVGVKPVFDSLPEGVVPYGFPFRASRERLPQALSLLSKLGLEPLPWPDLPSSLADSAPPHYRDVQLVHFLW